MHNNKEVDNAASLVVNNSNAYDPYQNRNVKHPTT